MKAGLAGLVVAACEHVQGRDPGSATPVTLALTDEEEVGSIGAERLVAYGLPPVTLLVVAEPTGNCPVVGHKGALWIDLVARGRSAHGSSPWLGDSALSRLRAALDRIEAWIVEHPGAHPALGPRTLNIGTVHAGQVRNAVPDHAIAQLDIRVPRTQDLKNVLSSLAAAAEPDAELQVARSLPPVWTKVNSTLLDQALGAISRRSGGLSPAVARYFTDASILTPALGDVPTLILGPGRPEQAHVIDEWCAEQEIREAVGIYRDLLAAFDVLASPR